MKERIAKKEAGIDEIKETDLLGFVLEQSNLDTEQFGDLLLDLLFDSHETTTMAFMLVMYFLHDCPKAVQHVRVYKFVYPASSIWYILVALWCSGQST